MEFTILDTQTYIKKTFEIEDEEGKIYHVYYEENLGEDIIVIEDEDGEVIDNESEIGEQLLKLTF